MASNPCLVKKLQINHEEHCNNPFLNLGEFDGGNWEECVIFKEVEISMFIKEYLNQAINKVGLEVTQPIHGVLIIYYDELSKAHAYGFLKSAETFFIYDTSANECIEYNSFGSFRGFIDEFLNINSPSDRVSKVSLISYNEKDKENRGVQLSF